MPPCKVLIVEDELLVATDLEMSLSRAGHDVVGVAESFDEAISLAQAGSPDLVLMDIELRGEQNGIAAARTMRERWQLPVVFLTANADEQTLAEARSAGPYGFLTKPFRNEELTETIRIALEQSFSAKKLFASHHWLTQLLDNLSDAVIATDADALVHYLNPAAEALTGWTPMEAMGRPIGEVYSLSHLRSGQHIEECLLKRALATGKFFGKSHFVLTTKYKTKVFIEDSAAPIIEDSRIIGAVSVFADISERLAEERRQEIERERLEDAAQVAAEALGQTRSELRALAADLMRTQEKERHRIARELHDDLGQQAAFLSMLVESVANESSHELPSLGQLRYHVSQLSTGLRETSHRLHPTIISDLGLAIALESLADQERLLGRNITFSASNVPHDLPLETATALYRIAQEGLHNAAKHAPGARVQMTLSLERKELHLRIRDNGPGFSPVEAFAHPGLGLVSMQERARLAGGSLAVSTRPGEGTVLLVRAPVGN